MRKSGFQRTGSGGVGVGGCMGGWRVVLVILERIEGGVKGSVPTLP